MNKICTSIEESKKLIELGIDVNTADMHYSTWTILNEGEYILSPNQGETIEELQENYGNQVIPAWSLSALLELIPPYLGEFNDGIDFGFSKAINGKWYTAHYIKLNDDGLASFNIFNITVTGDTAVDAAFEMVCWLKENRKI